MPGFYTESALVTKARLAATEAHAHGHPYGGMPFIVHPLMVATFGYGHLHLLEAGGDDVEERIEAAACALWLHDMIEDAAWTYNDVKRQFNERVAETVYYVSDHKGKTRAERQEQTYQEMAGRLEPTFVKLCDRYMNTWWTRTSGNKLLGTYGEEWEKFKRVLMVGEPAIHLKSLWEMKEALITSA